VTGLTKRATKNCNYFLYSACVNPGSVKSELKTNFADESVYEQTTSKIPKVIQFQLKLHKQKNFCNLINGSFNENKHSLRSNVMGGFGHKRRRLLMIRWKWRHK